MSVQVSTVKRLYAKSLNQCAMPKCTAPIIISGISVGEICHIKARRKKGPRYDSELSLKEKDSYSNLLLLCRTCHKLIDSDQLTYTPELLSEIKSIHETNGDCEITPEVARDAVLLLNIKSRTKKTSANSNGNGIAIAVGGNVNAPININSGRDSNKSQSKYPTNSIGADANMAGYVDYLFGLAVDYWKAVDAMNPGRLGKKIKTKFRLKTRTRYYIPVQRFNELVEFMIEELLAISPVGKRHARNGTRLCRSFEEWRSGLM
ncbi:MAG TPA: hypothetical protein DCX06_07480 [Opitutae bacterium]|nr:hypothetical protein [Opitutae bacterium]